MKDNIVQIRTTERVVKHGDEQDYFYGRIMLGFNESLQDFRNPSRKRKFTAIIRNVIFDEKEVDNYTTDENGDSVLDGTKKVRSIISHKDAAYTVNYEQANNLYAEFSKVVDSCAKHNEIKQFSLDHDTKASKTHYPHANYVVDDFDYSKLFQK